MKRKTVHWFSQNFKDLMGAGLVGSIFLIVPAALGKYNIIHQYYSYGRGPVEHWVMQILLVCLSVFCIVMTIVNYRYLLREGKCEPQSKKFTGLLVWELLCFIIILFVVFL